MKLKHLFLVLLSFTACQTAKAGGNVMFEQANALYHSKNYDSAAKLYTQLIQNGYSSDDLYYNMGNAFYKAGKVGWAIWSYRKSMAIQCTKNTLDNYRLAKKQIKNPLLIRKEIFFLHWWQSLYSLLTVNGWAIFALVCFIFFLLHMYFRLVRKKNWSPTVGYLFLILFLLSAFLMFIQYHNKINHYEAVIVERTPFESENVVDKELIPEGSEIIIVDKDPSNKEGRVLVKLSDLREGFVAKRALKRL